MLNQFKYVQPIHVDNVSALTCQHSSPACWRDAYIYSSDLVCWKCIRSKVPSATQVQDAALNGFSQISITPFQIQLKGLQAGRVSLCLCTCISRISVKHPLSNRPRPTWGPAYRGHKQRALNVRVLLRSWDTQQDCCGVCDLELLGQWFQRWRRNTGVVDVDWAVILVKVENYVNVFFGSLDGDQT